ncbi:Uncharacterized protein TCM_023958 [Theobroma cacao]|uniref:Uncharacterized protein n=1 Tax=Theobroma cacao TaxID=3641 RepID=A0A061EVX1_THECC|nr:Uncharacterized protein TCM_023958 [Theobroma cacao]
MYVSNMTAENRLLIRCWIIVPIAITWVTKKPTALWWEITLNRLDLVIGNRDWLIAKVTTGARGVLKVDEADQGKAVNRFAVLGAMDYDNQLGHVKQRQTECVNSDQVGNNFSSVNRNLTHAKVAECWQTGADTNDSVEQVGDFDGVKWAMEVGHMTVRKIKKKNNRKLEDRLSVVAVHGGEKVSDGGENSSKGAVQLSQPINSEQRSAGNASAKKPVASTSEMSEGTSSIPSHAAHVGRDGHLMKMRKSDSEVPYILTKDVSSKEDEISKTDRVNGDSTSWYFPTNTYP